MANRGAWPPSHRNPGHPQPEICDVTGFVVAGTDLLLSDVQGLRGSRVSAATPFLARARQAPSYEDRRRMSEVASIIGQGRVYDAGDEKWFGAQYPQEWATPQALEDLVVWFRNDDIPYSSEAATWPVPGGLSLPRATATTAASPPTVVTDPFATDYRGIRFSGTNSLTLAAAVPFSAAFTVVAAFLTTTLTSPQSLLSDSGTPGALFVAADGSVNLTNNAASSASLTAASAIAAATAYVLTVTRSALGVTAVRRNGVSVGNGATLAGTVTARRLMLGDESPGWSLAEIHAHSADHSADGRLAALERAVGRYVGVEL